MNLENWKILLEYFNLRQFFSLNSPTKLIILGIMMSIMGLIAYFLSHYLEKRLIEWANKKQATSDQQKKQMDDPYTMDISMFKTLMRDVRLLLYLFIFGWGLKQLDLGIFYQQALEIIFISLCTFVAIKFFSVFIPFDMDIYFRSKGTTLRNSQARSLMPIIKGIIWALGLTFLLDNLGCHVSTIIAGLGIMGVAVGLAGQAILADFFSYIVILFDKPFRMGDFVILGNGKSGDVIYMGPKTTRLRSLDGNLVICANSEMTKGVLINQGKNTRREVSLEIGIAYENPMPVVRKVPDLLRDVINSIPNCSYERACMLNFGTANYLFQLIYHVHSTADDINEFLEIQSNVNLSIQEMLNTRKISGAYPTQQIILSGSIQQIAEKPKNQG